jgi:hypothetical protein
VEGNRSSRLSYLWRILDLSPHFGSHLRIKKKKDARKDISWREVEFSWREVEVSWREVGFS